MNRSAIAGGLCCCILIATAVALIGASRIMTPTGYAMTVMPLPQKDYRITILGTRQLSQVTVVATKQKKLVLKPVTGKIFLVCKVGVTNKSTHALPLAYCRMIDSKGKDYAAVYREVVELKSLPKTVGPGKTEQGEFMFEVPPHTKPARFERYVVGCVAMPSRSMGLWQKVRHWARGR